VYSSLLIFEKIMDLDVYRMKEIKTGETMLK